MPALGGNLPGGLPRRYRPKKERKREQAVRKQAGRATAQARANPAAAKPKAKGSSRIKTSAATSIPAVKAAKAAVDLVTPDTKDAKASDKTNAQAAASVKKAAAKVKRKTTTPGAKPSKPFAGKTVKATVKARKEGPLEVVGKAGAQAFGAGVRGVRDVKDVALGTPAALGQMVKAGNYAVDVATGKKEGMDKYRKPTKKELKRGRTKDGRKVFTDEHGIKRIRRSESDIAKELQGDDEARAYQDVLQGIVHSAGTQAVTAAGDKVLAGVNEITGDEKGAKNRNQLARRHWRNAKKSAVEHPGYAALEILPGMGLAGKIGRGTRAVGRGTANVGRRLRGKPIVTAKEHRARPHREPYKLDGGDGKAPTRKEARKEYKQRRDAAREAAREPGVQPDTYSDKILVAGAQKVADAARPLVSKRATRQTRGRRLQRETRVGVGKEDRKVNVASTSAENDAYKAHQAALKAEGHTRQGKPLTRRGSRRHLAILMAHDLVNEADGPVAGQVQRLVNSAEREAQRARQERAAADRAHSAAQKAGDRAGMDRHSKASVDAQGRLVDAEAQLRDSTRLLKDLEKGRVRVEGRVTRTAKALRAQAAERDRQLELEKMTQTRAGEEPQTKAAAVFASARGKEHVVPVDNPAPTSTKRRATTEAEDAATATSDSARGVTRRQNPEERARQQRQARSDERRRASEAKAQLEKEGVKAPTRKQVADRVAKNLNDERRIARKENERIQKVQQEEAQVAAQGRERAEQQRETNPPRKAELPVTERPAPVDNEIFKERPADAQAQAARKEAKKASRELDEARKADAEAAVRALPDLEAYESATSRGANKAAIAERLDAHARAHPNSMVAIYWNSIKRSQRNDKATVPDDVKAAQSWVDRSRSTAQRRDDEAARELGYEPLTTEERAARAFREHVRATRKGSAPRVTKSTKTEGGRRNTPEDDAVRQAERAVAQARDQWRKTKSDADFKALDKARAALDRAETAREQTRKLSADERRAKREQDIERQIEAAEDPLEVAALREQITELEAQATTDAANAAAREPAGEATQRAFVEAEARAEKASAPAPERTPQDQHATSVITEATDSYPRTDTELADMIEHGWEGQTTTPTRWRFADSDELPESLRGRPWDFDSYAEYSGWRYPDGDYPAYSRPITVGSTREHIAGSIGLGRDSSINSAMAATQEGMLRTAGDVPRQIGLERFRRAIAWTYGVHRLPDGSYAMGRDGVGVPAPMERSEARRIIAKDPENLEWLPAGEGPAGDVTGFVVPKAAKKYWDRKYNNAWSSSEFAKVMRSLSRASVRVMLPLRASWHLFNAVSPLLRYAILANRNSRNPLALIKIDKRFRDEISDAVKRGDITDQAGREIMATWGGTHFGDVARHQRNVHRRVPLEDRKGLHYHATKLADALTSAPVVGKPIRGYKNLTSYLLDASARIEKAGSAPLRAQSLIDVANEFGFKQRQLQHAQAIQELIKILGDDPKALNRLHDRQLEMMGDYITRSPYMQSIADGPVPFINWYRESVKFMLKTTPRNSPVRFGLAVMAAQMTQSERAKLGLNQTVTDEEAKALGLPKPDRNPFSAMGVRIGDKRISFQPINEYGTASQLLFGDYTDLPSNLFPAVSRGLLEWVDPTSESAKKAPQFGDYRLRELRDDLLSGTVPFYGAVRKFGDPPGLAGGRYSDGTQGPKPTLKQSILGAAGLPTTNARRFDDPGKPVVGTQSQADYVNRIWREKAGESVSDQLRRIRSGKGLDTPARPQITGGTVRPRSGAAGTVKPKAKKRPTTVLKANSGLTATQVTFVKELAKLTGMQEGVIGGWVYGEMNGSAAAGRDADSNHNWLNIGYADSGPLPLTKDAVWRNPKSAARATAAFMRGEKYGPSDGIKQIIKTAGRSTDEQVAAIVSSGWATSAYDGADTLTRIVQQVSQPGYTTGKAPVKQRTPREIIDEIVLPMSNKAGVKRSIEENNAGNAAHGPTVDGNVSDHQGNGIDTWAADMSNGTGPTPEMDRLAARIAKRFGIPWTGSGAVSHTANGIRYQLIYRSGIGGNHYNHVHLGVKAVDASESGTTALGVGDPGTPPSGVSATDATGATGNANSDTGETSIGVDAIFSLLEGGDITDFARKVRRVRKSRSA